MSIKVISNLEISAPSNELNPATKKYVDDLVSPNKQNLSILQSSVYTTTLSNSSDKDGWLLAIANNTSPGLIKLPAMDAYDNTEVVTYEVIVRCEGSESNTISLVFVDNDSNSIEFLGENTHDLQRGYTYFLVFRNFPYGTQSVNGETVVLRQWVGNVQGRARIPS